MRGFEGFGNGRAFLGGPVPAGARVITMGGRRASTYGQPRRFALGQPAPGTTPERLRADGPLMRVRVGNAQTVIQRLTQEGKTPPAPEELVALIDTGASISAIDAAIAQRLGLLQTGSIQVGGVGGMSTQPVFAAALELPEFSIAFDPLSLSGAALPSDKFQMLLGRNILCNLRMTYDGPSGTFNLVKV